MRLFSYLLFPASLLYGSIVWTIQRLYNLRVFRRFAWSRPLIIKVGNLSVGGTGKTPHTAYLLRYFIQRNEQVGAVSRGYGRLTRENLEVTTQSAYDSVGDEPLMMHLQAPEAPFFVARKRAEGIAMLLERYPDTRVVLLDDAMQHWAVDSHFNILLTTFQRPFFNDYPLPMGRLREFRCGVRRANLIIVTQCPQNLLPAQRKSFIEMIKPQPHQQVLFSYYDYQQPYQLQNVADILSWQAFSQYRVLVVVAIAQTHYLEDFLHAHTQAFDLLQYPDHHAFDAADLAAMQAQYRSQPYDCIVTTEKDAVRLFGNKSFFEQQQIPIFVLPIRVQFHDDDAAKLDAVLVNLLHQQANL